MDQDATWCRRRPGPRGLCVTWGPRSLPKKGAEPPIFGPCSLWPNGWMHQDATWYGSRPQPRGLSVRWGLGTQPISPKSRRIPQFSAHVYCGHTAAWMPLDMEVGLGPDDIVLDGVPAPLPNKGAPPQFSAHVYCGHGYIKIALCTEVDLGSGHPAPSPKRGQSPPNFRPIFIVAKRLDTSRCHSVWG